jgi:hypothetical protein
LYFKSGWTTIQKSTREWENESPRPFPLGRLEPLKGVYLMMTRLLQIIAGIAGVIALA